MEKITLFILKNRAIRLSIILCFSFIIHKGYSQKSGDKFGNQNCEYIYFVNDTLIDFMLTGGYLGWLPTMYHGIGKYKIENDQLIIFVDNCKIDSLIRKKDTDSNCVNFKERNHGIDRYRIEILSGEVMKLIGPNIDNYHKLNSRRSFKSFLNWPWKWSFKKQHWYDPREIILWKLN